MHYVSTAVFLSTRDLISHTCIYGHEVVLSGSVFQASEGLAARISTEPFRPSGGGFLDQITSKRVLTSLR